MNDDAILSSRPRGGKGPAPDAGEIWRLLDDIAARGRAIRLARQSAEAGATDTGGAGDVGARRDGGEG